MLRSPSRFARLALCLALLCVSTIAAGQSAAPERKTRTEPLPKRLRGVEVDEHLGQKLPLDLGFTDDSGKPVTLKDYFKGDLPVVLTLNYSNCPMLCSMQLTGFVDGIKGLEESAGKEFRAVTISIDPEETWERARKTKLRYMQRYERPGSENGWAFLTGSKANVSRVADAMGFQYNYNEKRNEWVHPAAILVAAPDGTISRYLYGLEYHKKTLRLSLVEASQGKIGSTVDRLLLYCFHYDETEGRYAPVARNIMKVSGVIAVILLGGFIAALWISDRKRKPSLVT